ncbi:MAG: mandelate racemase/muconate lactonizing enzyme family protein [Trueperaceae bacterium]|nr:mandelate racemase/muconate lactonizing enzyme family protein [Trueperaceae bacterium]
MRIVELEAFEVAVPFRGPIVSAFGISYPARIRTFVRLTTENGITGIGEAGPSATHPYVRGSMPARFERDVRPAVLGESPIDHAWLARKLYHGPDAVAIELACWDIVGKALDVPLYRLWGGRGHVARVPLSAYAFFRLPNASGEGEVDLAGMAEHCVALRAASGFRTVKVKLGAHPPCDEIEVVRAVREALGPGTALRIDPNGSWSVATAVRALHRLRDLDLEYVEEPIRSAGTGDNAVDTAGLRRVRSAGSVPIAADHCYRLDLLAQIVRDDAADVVLVDVFGCGGPARALHYARTAATFGLGTAMHSGTELGVGQLAKIHLQAALGEEMRHASDAMYFEYVDDVLAGGPLRVVDGDMAVPQAPGLGAELDDAALARWELTDARKRDLDAYWGDLKGEIGTSYPSLDHLVRHY